MERPLYRVIYRALYHIFILPGLAVLFLWVHYFILGWTERPSPRHVQSVTGRSCQADQSLQQSRWHSLLSILWQRLIHTQGGPIKTAHFLKYYIFAATSGFRWSVQILQHNTTSDHFFKRVSNILCKPVKIWYLMFAAMRTECGRPLPVNLSVLAVWSIIQCSSLPLSRRTLTHHAINIPTFLNL